ncbi:hypothetical protein EYF80_055453 [Liparis tanakae]|uniref:Uncharacterized protein n=1 Tax=Liparis tanakae TaxID=230148 RepID=A0A4Z2F046_9TELE|nr:hypothetical protein EYF80_055453 [Liparis tanakae]
MYSNNTRQAVGAGSSSGADGGGGGKKTDGDILCRLGNCEEDKVARLILKYFHLVNPKVQVWMKFTAVIDNRKTPRCSLDISDPPRSLAASG